MQPPVSAGFAVPFPSKHIESDVVVRPSYDQARKVHGAVQAEYSGGPTREELIRENQALRCENAQL